MASPQVIGGAVAAAVIALITFTAVPMFIIREYFPYKLLKKQYLGKPTVNTKSYKGRTVLITGANGAFGSRASKLVAHRDVDTLVLVDVMDLTALKEDIESELKKENKPLPKILLWQIDMMTFAGCQEVFRRAKTDLAKSAGLDHVLLTAGILSFKRKESPEGWETTLQVNYFSTALVALLLLPLLKSSPGNPNPPVLTMVTSFGVYCSSFTYGVPKKGSYLKKMSNNKDGMEQGHQYGRSKALLLWFAKELAERTKKAGLNVTINSADPGTAWTNLTGPNRSQLIPRLITNYSARDPIYCATALLNGVSAGPESHGKILHDFDMPEYPPFVLRKSGQVAQQRIWDESREEFEAKVPEIQAVYKMLG
ncbi:hypothetical protein QBC38DRAFT_487814 [Podospora fimiseda]|uniref:Uncharacterized protein n=1 Tax=Podospora fimiseda TaxID=252190 RepID=A0AAN7BHF4_9PEZI|nr:hypothetical protein QBC38DRAFT_487814 [Podospora fimiseda]